MARHKNIGEIPQNLRPEHVEKPGRNIGENKAIRRPRPQSPRTVVLRGRYSQQAFTANDSASTVLNTNARRAYFIVQNNGVFDVFINFGNKASVNNIKIIAGGNYEPFICPIDSISLICAPGQSSLCAIIEAVEVN